MIPPFAFVGLQRDEQITLAEQTRSAHADSSAVGTSNVAHPIQSDRSLGVAAALALREH